jgi:hypothetical protein
MAGLQLSRAELRAALEDLVTASPDALARRKCFVHNNRVQIRADELAAWASEHGFGTATANDVGRHLREDHGFRRQPFTHYDATVPSGMQSASYYYSDESGLVDGLPVWDRPAPTEEERAKARAWLSQKAEDATVDEVIFEALREVPEITGIEGVQVLQTHLVRERDPRLVAAKKQAVLEQAGRLTCEACADDGTERYDELVQDLVECHHRIPLGEGDARETTLDDLALVCPNCHYVLHKTGLSVEELGVRLRSSTFDADSPE